MTAGAAAGTSCASGSGTGTFTPPLPDLTSKTKVKDVLTVKGSFAGCSGAVKSATITGASPARTGSNCLSIATPTKTPTKVTLTVTWNAGAASTVAAQLTEIPKTPVTTQLISGSVTKGQFAGEKLSGKFTYSLPKGACSKGHPLSTVPYKDVGALVIK